MQFHDCTASNLGTGADAFDLKCGVYEGPAEQPVRARFRSIFLPLNFDRLLFVYLLLFMHQATSNIIWHLLDLRMCTCFA